MLGADKKYVPACRNLLGGIDQFPEADVSYVYEVHGRYFAHVPHPSGSAQGSKRAFCTRLAKNPDENGMITCREQVENVVSRLYHGRVPT